jgi:hypothetical protein
MVRGNSIGEVKKLMPEVMNTFQRHDECLKEGQVPLKELVFTKILSKGF